MAFTGPIVTMVILVTCTGPCGYHGNYCHVSEYLHHGFTVKRGNET